MNQNLINALGAFESATRAHENIGSQPLEDHAIIEEEFKSAKENLIGEIDELSHDPALAVIRYITSDYVDGDQDAMEFLRYWNEGEFDVLRRNWENIPDEVFIGAEVGFVSKVPVKVGRHIDGITLNPLEFILDFRGKEAIFTSEECAKKFLLNNGFDEEALESLVFVEVIENA
ncbi:hypothetical protein [Acinetobacter brisouii]|uniref:hypothetical protein n=1 Tax=Acinetobacter brisouii TaxID=396323 RepID=UPI00124E7AAB|nr:hypothetical protein [Acinetobacter brisouii]